MAQLQSVQTFADSGSNADVNASRLNSHVNDATLLNGAVLDQSEKTTPVSADTLLLGDSTVAASGSPKKVQIGNLLLESQRNGTQQYSASDSGSANAYAVTLSPAPTAYTAGMVVRFRAGNSNTTTSTINVNSLGTKTIKNRDGNDLAANDILAGQIVILTYDGTYFQLNGISAGEVTATQATENFRQSINQYAADGGSANAYTVTLSPAATAYAAGMVVRFKASNANTGASTLNVNALGIKTIKKVVAGAVADILANDIQANDIVELAYDGTYFVITSRIRSWDFVGTGSVPASTSTSTSIAHGLGAAPTKWMVRLLQNTASAQQSYNQNDEVDIWGFQNASNGNGVFSVSVDATNVTVSRGNVGAIQVTPKGGGAMSNITESNWLVKVYASL